MEKIFKIEWDEKDFPLQTGASKMQDLAKLLRGFGYKVTEQNEELHHSAEEDKPVPKSCECMILDPITRICPRCGKHNPVPQPEKIEPMREEWNGYSQQVFKGKINEIIKALNERR